MTPCAITFSSSNTEPGLEGLRDSCKAWDWPLFIIEREWRGEGYRLKSVLNLASELKGFTHAVHVDAFDVLAVGPPQELESALDFYNFPPLLVACEGALWPSSPIIETQYGHRRSHFWFCHSQYVIDLTQPLPQGFGDLGDDASDQQHLHKLWLNQTEGMVLDRECRVVQSLAHCAPWEHWFAVEGKRVRNRITGSYPMWTHGNGRTEMGWVPR